MGRDLFATDVQPQQPAGRDLFTPRQQELTVEAQKRGLDIPDITAAVPDQIQQRQDAQLPDPDEKGILDYLMGIGEGALMVGTGAIAEPVAGMAGIAKTITSGPTAGAETIEQVQEGLTYQPRGDVAKAGMQSIGEAIGPTVKAGVEGYKKYVADPAFQAGGPIAGAAAMTVPTAIVELLGLKGTRAAKKMALGKLAEKVDVSAAYDEVGRLLPEIKEGLMRSGITPDEIKDVLPEIIPQSAIQETAEQIGEAAGTRVGQGRKLENIAEAVKPSQEILDAADELGLSNQMLSSHYSGNPLYVAIEQGLKSVPGSQLAANEKVLIANLAKKADDLIVEFGGEIDKSMLSDRFRSSSREVVKDLESAADGVYKELRLSIPRNTPVKTDNIIRKIRETADDLGGEEFLDANERELLNVLSPDNNPTYSRLDKFRKQIGQALSKKSGPFKDADEGALKQLYGALAEDQKLATYKQGFGELYDTANSLIVQRKGIEKQLVKVLGKDLSGNITAKARPAILGLQKGDTKLFDDLASNIPDELGTAERRAVFATALNDAFVQGSRAERSLSIPAFDDFMIGLNRNKVAKNRLTDELGADAVKRLDTLHKVIGGVRKAQKSEITTGRIAAVPGMLDQVDTIANRLWGTAKKIAAVEGVTSVAGAPGLGTAGVIGAALSAPRTARSVMADQLLSSRKFQTMVNRKAAGNLDTVDRIDRAAREIEKLKAYQKWKETLNDRELKDLATVGAIGYLTGETNE